MQANAVNNILRNSIAPVGRWQWIVDRSLPQVNNKKKYIDNTAAIYEYVQGDCHAWRTPRALETRLGQRNTHKFSKALFYL